MCECVCVSCVFIVLCCLCCSMRTPLKMRLFLKGLSLIKNLESLILLISKYRFCYSTLVWIASNAHTHNAVSQVLITDVRQQIRSLWLRPFFLCGCLVDIRRERGGGFCYRGTAATCERGLSGAQGRMLRYATAFGGWLFVLMSLRTQAVACGSFGVMPL